MPQQQEVGGADMMVPDYQFFEVKQSNRRKDRQQEVIVAVVWSMLITIMLLIIGLLVEAVTILSDVAAVSLAGAFAQIPGLLKTGSVLARLRAHGF